MVGHAMQTNKELKKAYVYLVLPPTIKHSVCKASDAFIVISIYASFAASKSENLIQTQSRQFMDNSTVKSTLISE